MVVIYGYKTSFKREGRVGHCVCSNCGHDADQTLTRQMNQGTLFYIPIVNITAQRGIMCESCGNIAPLGKQEYNDRKKMASQPQ